MNALEQLYALEALDNTGSITKIGKNLALFPLDPTFAKIILHSAREKCTREAIDIVSMLSVDPIFFSPIDKREESQQAKRKFMNYDGDHITYLNVLREYVENRGDITWCTDNYINNRSMKHVMDIRKQLESFCIEQKLDPTLSCGTSFEPILKSITAGFFKNIAIKQLDGSYKTLGSRELVQIHPSSILFQLKQECVLFSEWVKTSKSYLRNCSVVKPSWLSEIAPHYYKRNSLLTISGAEIKKDSSP